MKSILVALLSVVFLNVANAQYNLVWSDEFNGDSLDVSKWNVESNIGIWNTGSNKELQHYRRENISFGTDSLGNKSLIISAKKENYEGYQFTSGKIDTKTKFSVKYGKIEARIKMPNIADGLWPAFWMLGFTPDAWPKCGEIDIVEMGFNEAITKKVQNKFIKSTLHWDNNNSYAGYGDTSIQNVNLNEDYHIYSVEWTPSYIKSYIDNVQYFVMNTNGSASDEFNSNLFFIIFDLAIGGSLPGITDPSKITASMPANMYIDYVKVYQKSNEGSLNPKPHALYGNIGIYDETGAYGFKLDPVLELKIDTVNLVKTNQTAQEGSECAAFNTIDGKDFQLSFSSKTSKNLENLKSGSIYFYLKTDFQDDIKVAFGGQEITLNSSSAYNVNRDGNWNKVQIPFSEFPNVSNWDSFNTFLTISGIGKSDTYIAIDKVYLSPIAISNENYLGILTENPNISNKIIINNQSVHLYIWENTLINVTNTKFYEGKSDISMKGVAGKTWFGYGIFSDNAVDLSDFSEGTMYITIKTLATNEFWLGIGGANSTEGKITFPANGGLYGFERDGLWHTLAIPMADFIAKGVNLSACGNIFMLGGAGVPSTISVDDIYLSKDGNAIENPGINTVIDTKNKAQISISPNPTSDFINIKGIQSASVEITDLSGKTILKTNFNSELEPISIQHLTKGVYFIKIKETNNLYMQKLIKK